MEEEKRKTVKICDGHCGFGFSFHGACFSIYVTLFFMLKRVLKRLFGIEKKFKKVSSTN